MVWADDITFVDGMVAPDANVRQQSGGVGYFPLFSGVRNRASLPRGSGLSVGRAVGVELHSAQPVFLS